MIFSSKKYLLAAIILAALTAFAIRHHKGNKATTGVLDIRGYNLKPGTGREYHKVVEEIAIPMLKRWKMDIVAYGPSKHSPDSYYLIRAFKDTNDRKRQEDAFYGSEEWKKNAYDTISSYILNYTVVVVDADDETVKQLRKLVVH